MIRLSPWLTGIACVLVAGAAQAQTAFIGSCDAARTYAAEARFLNTYRGVQRETPASDPCGRDVVTVYNLQRYGSVTDYTVVGRQYYVWPTRGDCDIRGAGPFVSGTARLTHTVVPHGDNCRVVLTANFQLRTSRPDSAETYADNFSAPITPIGENAQQFAVTREGATEAMIFYAAPIAPHVTARR